MPNRKITQFPSIEAGDIVDQDVLTLVDVFEVDPALRNKKITFTEFRNYLNNYYVNTSDVDPFEVGNLLVSGYLTVSGSAILGGTLNVTGESTFESGTRFLEDVNISTDLTVTGNITGNQVTVQNVITNYSQTVSGNFTIATGITTDFVSGYFDNLSGTTITGESLSIVSGTFIDATVTRGLVVESGWFTYLNSQTITGATSTLDTINSDLINVTTLNAANLSFSGDQSISGSLTVLSGLNVSGSGVINGDLNVGGTITGNTISGNQGIFTYLSGVQTSGDTARFNTFIASTGIVNSGTLDNRGNAGFGGIVTITGDASVQSNLTVTGNVELQNNITVTGNISTNGNITGNGTTVISGINRAFVESGNVSGLLVRGDLNVLGDTNLGTISFSGDLIVSGDLTVTGDLVVDNDISASGNIVATTGTFTTVTGTTALFTSGTYQNLIGITTSGTNLNYTNITGTTITGQNFLGTNSTFTNVTGTTITGQNFLGTNGTFTNLTGVTITGVTVNSVTGLFNVIEIENSLNVSGNFSVSGNTITSGLIVQNNAEVSGVLTSKSGLVVQSGQAEFPWGTSGNPGITFTGDQNTGFYNDLGEKISTTCNGNRAMTIESGTGSSAGRFVLTIWSA